MRLNNIAFIHMEPSLLGGPFTFLSRLYERVRGLKIAGSGEKLPFGFNTNFNVKNKIGWNRVIELVKSSDTTIVNGVLTSDFYGHSEVPEEYSKFYMELVNSLSNGKRLVIVDHNTLPNMNMYNTLSKFLCLAKAKGCEVKIIVSQQIIRENWEKSNLPDDIQIKEVNFTLALAKPYIGHKCEDNGITISCRASNNRIYRYLDEVVKVANDNYKSVFARLAIPPNDNWDREPLMRTLKLGYEFNVSFNSPDNESFVNNSSYYGIYLCASFYEDRVPDKWYATDWGIVEALECGMYVISTPEQKKTLDSLGIKASYFKDMDELFRILCFSRYKTNINDFDSFVNVIDDLAKTLMRELFGEEVKYDYKLYS